MDLLTLFKRYLMGLFLLGVVVVTTANGYHRPVNTHYLAPKEEAESSHHKFQALYSNPNNDSSYPNPVVGRILKSVVNRRPARSVQKDEPSRAYGCHTVNYFSNSPVGNQVSCPFEWTINYESRRIPERIIEQVCRNCRSCGPHRQCAQLKVQYQVYFRDTQEFSQQVVRAGCVCMPSEMGRAAINAARFSLSSFREDTGDKADVLA